MGGFGNSSSPGGSGGVVQLPLEGALACVVSLSSCFSLAIVGDTLGRCLYLPTMLEVMLVSSCKERPSQNI